MIVQEVELSKTALRRLRRAFWEVEFPWCWYCEEARSECTHEMACGIQHRHKAVPQRFTWGAACSDCNTNRLTDYSLWPLEKQLAVKFINDRAYYDRVEFNLLRGREPEAITQREVYRWVRRIRRSKGRF